MDEVAMQVPRGCPVEPARIAMHREDAIGQFGGCRPWPEVAWRRLDSG